MWILIQHWGLLSDVYDVHYLLYFKRVYKENHSINEEKIKMWF